MIDNLNKKLEIAFSTSENFFLVDLANEAISSSVKKFQDKRKKEIDKRKKSLNMQDISRCHIDEVMQVDNHIPPPIFDVGNKRLLARWRDARIRLGKRQNLVDLRRAPSQNGCDQAKPQGFCECEQYGLWPRRIGSPSQGRHYVQGNR